MLPKSREPFGHTRATPRAARRGPAATDAPTARMLAAQQVAARFVAARWPELANVAPVVTAQLPQLPSPEMLARLGLDAGELVLRTVDGVEYTFTFAPAEDSIGALRPALVAVVTVDAQQRIVKTSASK